MKILKLTLLIGFLAIASINKSQAQNYATLNYWGKDIKLDRSFFEILNSNNNLFMTTKAPNGKYYDFQDYNDIYKKMVDDLTSPFFVIVVTEANQLQTRGASVSWPDSNPSNKNKKNRNRAAWIFYQVLLPSLQSFAQYK